MGGAGRLEGEFCFRFLVFWRLVEGTAVRDFPFLLSFLLSLLKAVNVLLLIFQTLIIRSNQVTLTSICLRNGPNTSFDCKKNMFQVVFCWL